MRALAAATLGLLFASCATPPARAPKARVMDLPGCRLVLPEWWDEVHVTLPEGVRDHDDVRTYVTATYGADTGTPGTWREALKTWALAAKRGGFYPVYVAHAYAVGGRHAEAARVFAALQRSSGTQGDLADWYGCYLAYSAGLEFLANHDLEAARRFWRLAAAYRGSSDGAVHYYAERSSAALADLDAGRPVLREHRD